ncbi:Cu(I)-responsive transcriptional regulator [Hoeflea alexandrii]|uniref:Cu(I)-responsive transcriptional regulator n=1 Tax=Hoeflea alexandrii TaxID=288436 RepID=A0ABT1CXK6_9HYPH|nr:Cu(I)-responsive transcriptional regulator [Hoeflea alexandrii]MCO6410935.1 Cu(I)-responsive transcriptional regulator [Hoeflea alexandrii]|tara:strand:- start:307 stop:702 length:396 start_codon:yes stop_codon:yes gene_type:complete
MNIGQASDATGLPAKTIRYYEDISLIKPARATNGYRDYDGKDVRRLALIQRSRSLGFTIEECRSLLSLYENKDRASSDVKELALERISEIDRKLKELKSLRNTLEILADHCHGDDRPDCPIIDEIAKGAFG